ncbi:hypothetical protein CDD81_560 [Ophiocordyceps australis]|uniref:Uncharacterized protein n=1 Tax=Ophiocordyceps australis TaxID=1399860 RepID=A0A2C5Y969_9HYPO|nr:hypothetical protein CDD81_560 [Ophiocordyceps australis]
MYSSRLMAALALCASLALAKEGTTTQTSTTTRTMTLTKCNPTMTNCPLKPSSMPMMESSASLSSAPQSSAPPVSAEVEPTEPTEPLAMPTGVPSSILPPVAPKAPVTSLVLTSSTMAPSPLTSSLPMMQPAKPMNQSSSQWLMPKSTMKIMPSGTGILPSIMTTSLMPSETPTEAATETDATDTAPSATTALVTVPSGSAGTFGASGNLVAAAFAVAVAAAL